MPVFIATPTSAWASAGASFVPSPVIATRWPRCLFLPDAFELRFRRRLRHEIVHAGFGGDGGGGERIVARDHHGADAHLAQLREAFLDAALDHVLELHDAEHLAAFRDDQRRAACARDFVHRLRDRPGENVRPLVDPRNRDRLRRAFANRARRLAVYSPENPRRSCASGR